MFCFKYKQNNQQENNRTKAAYCSITLGSYLFKNYFVCYCESPNNFNALNEVAKATSSGFLFMKAAIISTIAGNEQGSFLWKVQ